MDHTSQLTLFAANAQAISKEFVWQNALTKRLAALLFAQEGKPIDCDAIRRCLDLIKRSTGAFSTFRGNMALFVAAMLSLSPDPQGLLDETLTVYDLLKGTNLRASDFLVVAALVIAKQSSPAQYAGAVDRTRAFYVGMKANRFFSTGRDDYIFAAMLGLSDLDVATATEGIERLHRRLKGEFWNSNAVQALAQVLALGGLDDDAVSRALALRDALRAQKIKLDQSYTLSSLGVLALLPVEIGVIVQDIGEVHSNLRTQKGFGAWSLTTQQRLLFAAALVAGGYSQSVQNGILTATLSTSITNIIIAQQAAMIAAVSASSAASASASS